MRFKQKLMRERLVQKLTVPFGRDLSPDKWVFIVGCYNSGTTLLSTILGSHPDVAVLPYEGVVLTDGLPRPESFGWNRMWCKCQKEMVPAENGRGEKIARRIRRQWSFLFADRPVLLEKSIANTARTPFLNRHFRPAYFIYMIRNGYAAAEGIRNRAKPRKWGRDEFGEKYPIELCAEQWAVSDRVMAADAPKLDRLMTVRYESFTENPAKAMADITKFLEIAHMAEETLARSWRIHGHDSPIKNMNAESLARLNPEEIGRIEAVAGDVLKKYSYTNL